LHIESENIHSLSYNHQDLDAVGTLVGLKTFVNEFAAYDRLRQLESTITPRSR